MVNGYAVLDGLGGIHAGGGAPPVNPSPPYFGFDIARDLEFRLGLLTVEQRRTRTDMQKIGTANYAMWKDLGRYAQTLTELLEQGYLDNAATHDAWGNAFVYVTAANTYTLVSFGCDGASGPARPAVWSNDPSEPDLLILDGAVVQAPSGRQPKSWPHELSLQPRDGPAH